MCTLKILLLFIIDLFLTNNVRSCQGESSLLFELSLWSVSHKLGNIFFLSNLFSALGLILYYIALKKLGIKIINLKPKLKT
jgi:hypothetical protein